MVFFVYNYLCLFYFLFSNSYNFFNSSISAFKSRVRTSAFSTFFYIVKSLVGGWSIVLPLSLHSSKNPSSPYYSKVLLKHFKEFLAFSPPKISESNSFSIKIWLCYYPAKLLFTAFILNSSVYWISHSDTEATLRLTSNNRCSLKIILRIKFSRSV